uniref:Ubiquitin-like domain-containing protein n=1 Tax=Panagrolaimus sp. PS1159 TaxID=55785 RepID=A0AC35F1Y9_9BILA
MFFFVKLNSGKTLSINCSENDTVQNLMDKINLEKVEIFFNGIKLDKNGHLSDYGIDYGSVLSAMQPFNGVI